MNSRKRKSILIMVLLIALTMVSVAPIPNVIDIATVSAKDAIKLNKAKATVYIGGNTLTLTLNVTSQSVTWKSSNTKVAKVTKKGVVTGIKAGNAIITATYGGKSYRCKITVKELTASTTPTVKPTVAPTLSPTPEPPRITSIDGYDITESVNGTRLKDAYANYFTVGSAINGSNNNNSTVDSKAMSEILKYHFNSTTFSNLMKPSNLLDQSGCISNFRKGVETPELNFSGIVEGLEFAKANGIKMRGHVLVWHAQTPSWFFKEGYATNGNYVDRDTMLLRLESYIQQVMDYTQSNYPGVIYCWDVVNEAIETTAGHYETESGFNIRTKSGAGDNLWYKVVGVDYVEKSFEYARKYAASDVRLFYNDYNTFQPNRTQIIYKLANHLKQKGIIDGVGMQGYMDLYYPGIHSGNHNLRTAIKKFAELGLELHITELTISSDANDDQSMQLQAQRYKEVFQLLTEMDTYNGGPANITNVTFFGLMDEYLFYTNNTDYSRLFDKRLKPKPAFYSILSVVQ